MKIRAALRLGRVSNLPTVWSNVLAGVALAGWTGTSGVELVWLCGAMSLLYVGGMYLNDFCDAEIDARERAERPIPKGEATGREVLAWGCGMLAAGVGLAFLSGMPSGVAAVATVFVIVLYDLVHKRTLLAPALMAGCRVGVYWTAALSLAAPKTELVALGAAVLFAYVMGLTYAAAKENSTALVRYGPLLGLWAPALLAGPWLGASPLGLVVLFGFGVWVLRAIRLVRTREPRFIRQGIAALIAGMSLVDALWLALYTPHAAFALCAVVAFGATLALQRVVAGT
ncbi:MAG: UbiA family prenyltransferase [Polyangiales bacterium]